MGNRSMRGVTIALLVVAVAACFVPAFEPRPWLQALARVVGCAAFAAALLVFLLGLPRRDVEDHVADEFGPTASLRTRARGAR